MVYPLILSRKLCLKNDYLLFSCRNIDDVDKTMDEINEQTENMKQIQDALSAPLGASADFDEVTHCGHLQSVIASWLFLFAVHLIPTIKLTGRTRGRT